jgi:hypothetical protein
MESASEEKLVLKESSVVWAKELAVIARASAPTAIILYLSTEY